MRRELGSKSILCRHEISCYRYRIFSRCSVIFGFNDLLIYLLHANTVKRSQSLERLELGKYSASGLRRPKSRLSDPCSWPLCAEGRNQRGEFAPKARDNSVMGRIAPDVLVDRALAPAGDRCIRRATNWRQNLVPLIWRHVAPARLLC